MFLPCWPLPSTWSLGTRRRGLRRADGELRGATSQLRSQSTDHRLHRNSYKRPSTIRPSLTGESGSSKGPPPLTDPHGPGLRRSRPQLTTQATLPGLQDAITSATLNQRGREHLRTLLRTGQDQPPPEPELPPPPDPHQELRPTRSPTSQPAEGGPGHNQGAGTAPQPA
eukprot:8396202-Alexandrium_andersonii.AAC.1